MKLKFTHSVTIISVIICLLLPDSENGRPGRALIRITSTCNSLCPKRGPPTHGGTSGNLNRFSKPCHR